MSFVVQDWMVTKLKLKGNELFVFAYLYSATNLKGTCAITQDELCTNLNLSKDTVRKCTKKLITSGYIKCEQIKENGKFSHNIYTITNILGDK